MMYKKGGEKSADQIKYTMIMALKIGLIFMTYANHVKPDQQASFYQISKKMCCNSVQYYTGEGIPDLNTGGIRKITTVSPCFVFNQYFQ